MAERASASFLAPATKLARVRVMNAPTSERRRRRSEDVITALHYQLSHARVDGGLDALVLADESGSVIAGAGAWPVCEELAAFAPLMAEPANMVSPSSSSYRGEDSRDVVVRVVRFEGTDVLLAARGAAANQQDEPLQRAVAGCKRILSAENSLSHVIIGP